MIEDTVLNQVTLLLSFEKQEGKIGDKKSAIKIGDKKSAIKTGDKKSKTDVNIDRIKELLTQHGEMKTKDVAEYIKLGVSRTRELLRMMDEVEIVGGNKDRRYRLK